jgi:tryptophanyl-tRNA synthetase
MFLPFLDLQKSAPTSTSIYLSIVGLHAITLPQNPALLMESKRNMLASLLACGVDPDRTCLYFQEDVRFIYRGILMIGERTYGIMLVFQPHQSCWEITEDDYLEGMPLILSTMQVLS